MSVGDLLWRVNPENPQGVFGSTKRDAYNKEQQRAAKLEELRTLRERFQQEQDNLLGQLRIAERSASHVADIANTGKDRDTDRRLEENRGNANIYTGIVLPETTRSTIAINTNTFNNQAGLITKAGELAGKLQSEGITDRAKAAERFFPAVTEQIQNLQKAPIELAMYAINAEERDKTLNREFAKDVVRLQNPKRSFGQQLLSAAPGLAAAALLAFT